MSATLLLRAITQTSETSGPSKAELIQYFHINDCSLLLDHWKDHWQFCPVCGARPNNDDTFVHSDRKVN